MGFFRNNWLYSLHFWFCRIYLSRNVRISNRYLLPEALLYRGGFFLMKSCLTFKKIKNKSEKSFRELFFNES